MGSKGRILFIDDELRLCKNVQILLSGEDYDVDIADSGAKGLEKIYNTSYDIVITDLIMPDVSGLEIIRYVQQFLPDTIVIVITGYASMESAITAMREGAYDYVIKPLDFDFLKLSLERALEKSRLRNELRGYYQELEERVRERTRELEEAQKQLIQSEKLAAIGELSAIMAHEIKNPLASIGGFARVLQKKAKHEKKVKEISAIIHEEVVRLEKILENLLSFTWDKKLELRPVNPNKMLQGTMKLLSSEITQGRIELTLDLDRTAPTVWLDGDKIRQVILNICTNAIHAMPEGGRLMLRTGRTGDQVLLEIADTGHGIPPEHMEKVFSPFFSTKAHGTGLGLAICNKLIQDHGGRIELRSAQGAGTTVSILLPVKREPASNKTLASRGPPSSENPFT